jgi:rhodanese-related sulfurtransferase
MIELWNGLNTPSPAPAPRRIEPTVKVQEIVSVEPAELVELQARLGDKLVVVDVRNCPPRMLRSTLPGAKIMSVEELDVRWRQLPSDATLVIYCWDGWSTLSTRAAHLLSLRGLKVRTLAGGIRRWRELGLDEVQIASPTATVSYH